MCREILEEIQTDRRLRGPGPNPASVCGCDRCRQPRHPRAVKRRLQKDRQMETIGLSSPLPSARHAGWAAPEVGIAMSQNANPGKADFLATLLAMAGHDLRQPLQLIASAHDVLGRIVHSDEQREELAQAGTATRRLADMLSQLVEALELHERSSDHLHFPTRLHPILDDLAAEFDKSAQLKRITLRVTAGRGAALTHPVLLGGMLRNLIRNAIDYTLPGGSVFVASRRVGSQLHI